MNFYLASKKVIPTTKNAIVIGNSLGHDLTLSNGQYHHINTRTLVEGLGPCIKLTAWGGKDKFEAHSAPELENAVKNNIKGVTELIFDFEKLEYMASAGLRVLLSAAKVMKKQGSMKIINVTEPVMDVFTFTGMADMLEIEKL